MTNVIMKYIRQRLTVAFYLDLCLLHLLHEARVANDTSCIAHLATRLVQTCDDAHNRPLCNVGQVRYLLKRLMFQRAA